MSKEKKSDFKDKFEQVGAGWMATNGKDQIKVRVSKGKFAGLNMIGFKNNFKKEEKHPDYLFHVNKDRGVEGVD